MIRSLVLAVVLVSGCSAATGQHPTVPERFRGEWNVNLDDCGTGLNASRLRIGAHRVRFYESGGPVRAVVTEGKSDLAVIMQLAGEGQTWLAYKHFRLSGDHTRLIDVTHGDAGMVRYRCAAGSDEASRSNSHETNGPPSPL